MSFPTLVIHGGAWAIPDDLVADHLRGVKNAVAAGWSVLERGGQATDAVEAAIIVMENDEAFDAGRGSFLNRDGKVQCDALLMDGATLRAGGVGCVERIRNPIVAAHRVLEDSPHVYFVGEGAERFAHQLGVPLIDNSELIIPREVERLRQAQAKTSEGSPQELFTSPILASDTVGALALDKNGNLAAGTSTGGTLNKAPGRVGDSSLIGCGCYADNESGAASTTGWGEPMMKLVLAKHAADLLRRGKSPEESASESIAYLKQRLNGHGGIILLDRKGAYGIAHNTPRMAWGTRTSAGEATGIQR